MKYRIKNIRREGWVETEENLYRPIEEVSPITLPDTPTEGNTDQFFIITDDTADNTGEIYIVPDLPEVPETPTVEAPAPIPVPTMPVTPMPAPPIPPEIPTRPTPEVAPPAESTQVFTPHTVPAAQQPESTQVFTPPANPAVQPTETAPPAENTQTFAPPIQLPTAPPAPNAPADEKTSYFKTKEGKIMLWSIGGFALLLTVVILVFCFLPGGSSGDSSAPTTCTHNFQTIIEKEATCDEPGSVITKCINCNYTAEGSKPVKALDHKWTKDNVNSTDATCEEDGTIVEICERCGKTNKRSEKAKGHTWVTDEIYSEPATCEKDGVIVKKCSVCNKSEREEQTAKGHAWVEIPGSRVEATCAKEGKVEYRCGNCSERKTETIDKTEHKLGKAKVTDPTCDKEGKKVAVCEKCGETVTETLERLPHETEPATCTVGEKCKNCNREISDPLGHKFENGKCTVCGAEENSPQGSHVSAGTGILLSCGSTVTVNDTYIVSGSRLNLTLSLAPSGNYLSNPLNSSCITVKYPNAPSQTVDIDDSVLGNPPGNVDIPFSVKYNGAGKYVISIAHGKAVHTCTITVE